MIKKLWALQRRQNRRKRINEYTIIEPLSPSHSVILLCHLSGVSRSGYYKWLHNKSHKSARQMANKPIMNIIMECHTKFRGIYGYPRIQVWLHKTYGLRVNHNTRISFNETASYPFQDTPEKTILRSIRGIRNLFNLPIHNKFLYLSTIFDLYNNGIVMYKISLRNDLPLVLDTVRPAVDQRNAKGALLQSDQGFQSLPEATTVYWKTIK